MDAIVETDAAAIAPVAKNARRFCEGMGWVIGSGSRDSRFRLGKKEFAWGAERAAIITGQCEKVLTTFATWTKRNS